MAVLLQGPQALRCINGAPLFVAFSVARLCKTAEPVVLITLTRGERGEGAQRQRLFD